MIWMNAAYAEAAHCTSFLSMGPVDSASFMAALGATRWS